MLRPPCPIRVYRALEIEEQTLTTQALAQGRALDYGIHVRRKSASRASRRLPDAPASVSIFSAEHSEVNTPLQIEQKPWLRPAISERTFRDALGVEEEQTTRRSISNPERLIVHVLGRAVGHIRLACGRAYTGGFAVW